MGLSDKKPITKTKVDELASEANDASHLTELIQADVKQGAHTTVTIEEASAAKRRADNAFMKKRIKDMGQMMRSAPKRTIYPSAGLAQFLGRTFTFLLNGYPITVNLNSQPQEFPDFVADVIDRKLREALDANAPKDIVNRVVV